MRLAVHFYRQTTGFTCDPACLMMALKYFNPKTKLSRKLEFEIWRESYGIGIPGCMPQGLAYSASKRGLKAAIVCRKNKLNQISGKIAKGENKETAVATSKHLLEKSVRMGTKIIDKSPEIRDIERALSSGQIPLLMINMKSIHNVDSPHWIVVSGFDKDGLWINDPYSKKGGNMKISRKAIRKTMADLNRISNMAPRMLIISKRQAYRNY